MDNSPHWTKGGTAITNFDPKQAHIYAKAIEEYGDMDLFIGAPIPGCISTDKALRSRNGGRRNLSEFWKIFERIKKEEEEKK